MSSKIDIDDRVSSFGFFLRFVLRKKRLRVPQVAQSLGWTASAVDAVLYKNAEPPLDGDVERILGVLEIEGLEADALRLLAAPSGTYTALSRQLDERTAELFEARAALETREAEARANKSDSAITRMPNPLSTTPPPPDPEQVRFRELWRRTASHERLLIAWLLETGLVATLHDLFAHAGWKPAPAKEPRTKV